MGESIKGFEINSNGHSTIKKYDYNSLDNIPELDDTLTSQVQPAQAKKVGDEINNLQTQINSVMSAYTTWITNNISELNVLAMGDSICYGIRNQNKGYIGDVGCKYNNIGSANATLAMTKDNNIPKQLFNLTNYVPNAIITNGGISDYNDGVIMGDMPETIIDPNIDNINSLNKNTVLGGLQYIFYLMITKFPNAHRFFLMPHHILNWDKTNGAGNWNFDLFYENVSYVCKMYSVKIIDLYTQSPINTRYSQYKSTTGYSTTPPATETGWVNIDGINPLPFGYIHGYAPFIKEALRTVINVN